MTLRLECLCVDAHDPAALGRFWAEVLGWQVTEETADEVLVQPSGGGTDAAVPELLFLRVPDDKVVKNRLHLDLRPDDQAAEVARIEALGARRADIGQSPDVTWVVLADPEGNEFCVLGARSDS